MSKNQKLKQIKRFIERRNKSPFGTNFAFGMDLQLEGLCNNDLGDAERGAFNSWIWKPIKGFVLMEWSGKLQLLTDSEYNQFQERGNKPK